MSTFNIFPLFYYFRQKTFIISSLKELHNFTFGHILSPNFIASPSGSEIPDFIMKRAKHITQVINIT